MGNALLIKDFGPGENSMTIPELRELAAQGASIHLNGSGLKEVMLTIARVVDDKEAFKKP